MVNTKDCSCYCSLASAPPKGSETHLCLFDVKHFHGFSSWSFHIRFQRKAHVRDMTVPKKTGSNLIFLLNEVKAEAATSLSALSTLKVSYLLVADSDSHHLRWLLDSGLHKRTQKISMNFFQNPLIHLLLLKRFNGFNGSNQDPGGTAARKVWHVWVFQLHPKMLHLLLLELLDTKMAKIHQSKNVHRYVLTYIPCIPLYCSMICFHCQETSEEIFGFAICSFSLTLRISHSRNCLTKRPKHTFAEEKSKIWKFCSKLQFFAS